jgi:ABC-2 type transport system permease protein
MNNYWITAMLCLNWKNMVTHRASFYSLMLLMFVQNLIYFSLWIIVFSKISSLNGWGLREVAFLFSAGALGYGLLFTIFGGLNQIGSMIESGELDIHLARPRPILLMLMLQRLRSDSLGDAITGLVMLAFFVRPPVEMLPLLAVLTLTAGIAYFSFRLFCHALVFWGNPSEASENMFIAFLITSTNPQNGFAPWVKFLLLSIFPAGYVGLLPVEILRHFSWTDMALQVAGSCGFLLFAVWMFHRGVRRYASGSRMMSLK